MTRREDWPERLFEAVERHAALAVEWGVSDCFVLCMDAVLAMTDAEPWPELRGAYATEMGAAKQLRSRGVGNVADLFASAFAEIPAALAGRGDLGVVAVPYGAGFAGVVFVDTMAVGKHADQPGLIRVPRSVVARAFRVP